MADDTRQRAEELFQQAHPLSRVFEAAHSGDPQAASQLLPLLYKELRRLAQSLLAEKPPGQTLQATALVHEAYVRIARKGKADWVGRRQFFATVARAMRDLLVEEARRKAALKRGGDRERVPLEGQVLAIELPVGNVLELDEALKKLEGVDRRKGEITRLRYFAGLKVGETADVLGVSKATVERELRYIHAWLSRELKGDG